MAGQRLGESEDAECAGRQPAFLPPLAQVPEEVCPAERIGKQGEAAEGASGRSRPVLPCYAFASVIRRENGFTYISARFAVCHQQAFTSCSKIQEEQSYLLGNVLAFQWKAPEVVEVGEKASLLAQDRCPRKQASATRLTVRESWVGVGKVEPQHLKASYRLRRGLSGRTVSRGPGLVPGRRPRQLLRAARGLRQPSSS